MAAGCVLRVMVLNPGVCSMHPSFSVVGARQAPGYVISYFSLQYDARLHVSLPRSKAVKVACICVPRVTSRLSPPLAAVHEDCSAHMRHTPLDRRYRMT